jgi:cytosine/adenosine deaminase-related metal-dependent hydrolase
VDDDGQRLENGAAALRQHQMSRRGFMASCTGLAAGTLAAPGLPETALAADFRGGVPAGPRILLKGGAVLTMDDALGSLEQGDVLIDGETIAEVGPNIEAPAQVIDASGMIVMPGFVDTHHHQYETIQRAILADGILFADWPEQSYVSVVQNIWTNGRNDRFDLGRSPYEPNDNYISELVASLSQINAGVTTGIDTSQSSHTPAHTEAMIAGLMDSGRRTVFAYSPGRGDAPDYEYPGAPGDTSSGLGRLKSEFFSSGDQLVTLALGGLPSIDNLRLARHVDVPLVSHVFAHWGTDAIDAVGAAGMLGPDQVYIHCTQFADDTFKKIADSGGHVSIATTIEMSMRHGMPPLQQALDHGIVPSLSTDVETNMAADMFTVMRSTFTLQRALVNERHLTGETDLPNLVSCQDVLRMATIAGARAAGLDGRIGSLTMGKQADIVMLDARRINTMPLNNAPGVVVTMMDTSNVRNVFIAGRVVKWNHELVGVDLDKLRGEIEASRDAVLGRIRSAFPDYAPSLVRSCCLPYG